MSSANVLIAAPIYSDAFTGNLYTPALSGGSWEAGNPLANLQDRRLHRIARSTNALESSTVLTADLGTARPVRCIAIPKHTISSAGTVRARGFLSVPVLDSLTVGDAAWTIGAGTPTRSAAAYTAPDGVPMDLIGDDDAGAAEHYRRTITFTGDGTKCIAVRVKAGTSTSTLLRLRDVTASADRLLVSVTWSGGVPTAVDGTGATLSLTALGDGAYRWVVAPTGVVAANTNNLLAYPAETTAVAGTSTGTTYFADALAWNAATDQQVHDSGYTAAIPAGLTTEDTAGLNCAWASVVPSGTTSARYWRVNISDTTNAAGYVDLARLVIAGGYQPTINMAPGASISLESDTTRTVSDGGAAIYDTRPLRRVARFSVQNLSVNEAFTQAWRVQKHLGASTQCFVMLSPEAAHAERVEQSFLATIRELSAIEYREAAYGNLSLAVQEEL